MMVKGHNSAKDIFERIIKKGKFVNGYIFWGIEGIGKKLFAIETARSALCRKNSFYSPCGCDDCRYISGGTHPDIFIIDTEDSSISIETVRNITENAFMTPCRGEYKFFIINDAHKLTRDASNAFLKTLEEPPENTVFILITHLPDHLIATVRSRCIQVEFSRLSKNEIVEILKEKYPQKETDTLKLPSEKGFGSIKTAINFLENKSFVELPQDIFKNIQETIVFIQRIKERDNFLNTVQDIYKLTLDAFKESGDSVFIDFSNYLMDILHMVEYNLNLDIAKTDIITKLYGAFSEKN